MDETNGTPAAQSLRLARDLRTLADDAEALLRHAVQDAGDGYNEARSRLQQSLARAKAQLAATDEAIRGRVRDAGGTVDAYVHENPWQAVGAAAAVGALVALLLTRR